MAYEILSENAIEIVNELHHERLDYESEYVPLIEALNRLAELEDKIENGLLVERPCKVGDKFYEVIPGLPPREWIVDEFMEQKETVVVFGRLNTKNGGFWKFWIDDFGNKIFTTKEDAEAKLKELEGK